MQRSWAGISLARQRMVLITPTEKHLALRNTQPPRETLRVGWGRRELRKFPKLALAEVFFSSLKQNSQQRKSTMTESPLPTLPQSLLSDTTVCASLPTYFPSLRNHRLRLGGRKNQTQETDPSPLVSEENNFGQHCHFGSNCHDEGPACTQVNGYVKVH